VRELKVSMEDIYQSLLVGALLMLVVVWAYIGFIAK
jgi:hypothetical protein